MSNTNFSAAKTFNTVTAAFAGREHLAAAQRMIQTQLLLATGSRKEFVKALREYATDAEHARCPEAMEVADLIREMATLAETGEMPHVPVAASASPKALTIEQLLRAFVASEDWSRVDFEVEQMVAAAYGIEHREVRRIVNILRG